MAAGLPIFVAGFGESDFATEGVLTGGYLTIINNRGAEFEASDLDEGSMPCHGDSGGPALAADNGKITVVGIVVRGDATCPPGGITTFVNPGSPGIRKFLTDTIAQHK